ncbi:exodeoxyribonuclease V subunit alpha [Nocardioides sp.]|uniref:exodeoxyribonuclease V subunit alpha n=1 Tax=Nocardioides sp. TaxID=35761 RepID=UPI002ED2AEEC
MTELFEPTDAADPRLAATADGLLGRFNAAGLLTSADVHVARRLTALAGDTDELVALAVAAATTVIQRGSVGVDLAGAHELAPDLPWPDPAAWHDAVAASALVEQGGLRLAHGLVYLDRYHRLEEQVFTDLTDRADRPPPEVDEPALARALTRVFPDDQYAEQRDAIAAAAHRWTTVLTGGPGTGKTTTVAGLLAVLADQAAVRGHRLSIALAAPTGKAAARLQESVDHETARFPAGDQARLAGLESLTLHRLLGFRPDNSTRFRHHRHNRLKYDVVVVDESSMVELMLMGRLLEALRPDTRLILVGDPDQLSSVGAGAVLGDLVKGYAARADSPVVALTTNHRYGEEIGRLAVALRDGDADAVMDVLRAGGDRVSFVETDDAEPVLKPDLVEAATALRAAAEAGDDAAALAELDRHRLICAHRDGPRGVAHWNRQVERWLAQATGQDFWPRWYPGRPVLVTSNDYGLGIYNGETGVVVRRPDGELRGLIPSSGGTVLDFATTRLAEVETMHALTVHKSQGSQVDHVTVLLPAEDSRLLGRELFYTAVTRARQSVRVVGTEAEVRAAVARRAVRATGLAERLRTQDPGGET